MNYDLNGAIITVGLALSLAIIGVGLAISIDLGRIARAIEALKDKK